MDTVRYASCPDFFCGIHCLPASCVSGSRAGHNDLSCADNVVGNDNVGSPDNYVGINDDLGAADDHVTAGNNVISINHNLSCANDDQRITKHLLNHKFNSAGDFVRSRNDLNNAAYL